MKNVVFCDVTPCGFLRKDVSQERSAIFIWLIRIDEVRNILAISSNLTLF
jgi:hypothetical protein